MPRFFHKTVLLRTLMAVQNPGKKNTEWILYILYIIYYIYIYIYDDIINGVYLIFNIYDNVYKMGYEAQLVSQIGQSSTVLRTLFKTHVHTKFAEIHVPLIKSLKKVDYYCWWLKSCTTWYVKTLQIMGETTNLNWLAGFQPSTVSF